jgi:Raf kinase inhibitor-like YbhB/YbcL family protein
MRIKGLCFKVGLTICLTAQLLIYQDHSVIAGSLSSKTITNSKQEAMKMEITSMAFTQGKSIPAKFTCDGENISPALNWANLPANAKSLALVCDDPDAPRGIWVHWIVVNIPISATGIPENGPLPTGAYEIINSFGQKKYGGPCPPNGTHRYFFKLYALDVADLKGSKLANFKDLIDKHTMAQTELMGTYRKR